MTIGIGIMIVGIWMAAARIHKDYYYGLATGKVVESSYYENSDDERMYSAIYAYFVGDTECIKGSTANWKKGGDQI